MSHSNFLHSFARSVCTRCFPQPEMSICLFEIPWREIIPHSKLALPVVLMAVLFSASFGIGFRSRTTTPTVS